VSHCPHLRKWDSRTHPTPSSPARPKGVPGQRGTVGTRPTITITLRPEPRVDGMAALRLLLKAALRLHGLKCVAITAADPLVGEPSAEKDVAD
jgi:hypothetical protein